MKATFFHDGPTYVDPVTNQFYACVLNDHLIDRYFLIANELTIVNRIREIDHQVIGQYEKIEHINTKIVKIPEINSIGSLLKSYFEFKRIVEDEVTKSDVVIARIPSISGGLSIEYALKIGKPIITELVGCPFDSLWNYGIKGKLLAPFMWLWTKRLVSKSKYVIYVTNNFLQHRYPNRNFSIGISDVSIPITNLEVLDRRLKRIEKESNKLVLCTIAGIDIKYKGQKHVIKALSILKSEGLEVEYILYGSGSQILLSKIAKKYNVLNNVIFAGSVPHSDIFTLLDNIDIYVQPSETEGMPRALIEAMSRACPCIGTNIGGMPELLDNNHLFQKGNSWQIAQLIKSFDKKNLLIQANVNYEKSKLYSENRLSLLREGFIGEFIKQQKLNDFLKK